MSQIREQMLVPDLHVLYTQITHKFETIKKDKNMKKENFPKKTKKKYLFSMQLFRADATMFSIFNFFSHKKMKKPPSKVAHNRPKPFFKTVQPRPQPTAQIFNSVL